MSLDVDSHDESLIQTKFGAVSINSRRERMTAWCLKFSRDQFGPFYNFDDILYCLVIL